MILGNVRVLVSRQGREYRQRVAQLVGKVAPHTVPLAVTIHAYPPDNRRRDLDNVLKAALDALTGAGVWDDDSQIADLRIVRMPVGEARLDIYVAQDELREVITQRE